MNKRQAKKERDKLIIAGRTYKGTRLKKRHDKKIWGMLKKNFDNCEYQECRNCRHKYSTLECELCVNFDMYEEAL